MLDVASVRSATATVGDETKSRRGQRPCCRCKGQRTQLPLPLLLEVGVPLPFEMGGGTEAVGDGGAASTDVARDG
jgi:hypothetical protein